MLECVTEGDGVRCDPSGNENNWNIFYLVARKNVDNNAMNAKPPKHGLVRISAGCRKLQLYPLQSYLRVARLRLGYRGRYPHLRHSGGGRPAD